MTEQPEHKPMTIEEINRWFDNIRLAFDSGELYMLIRYDHGVLNLLSCSKTREDLVMVPQPNRPPGVG